MMYLVDANVLSKPTKPVPSSKGIDWLTANERILPWIPLLWVNCASGFSHFRPDESGDSSNSGYV